MTTMIEMLEERWHSHESALCVGLDPDPSRFPDFILEQEYPIFTFCQAIVDATANHVCAFKPQIAYFSALGAEEDLEMLSDYIKEYYPNIPVILDAKRGDIGSTAEMYALEAFERYGADALTVNPYLGDDSIQPYLEYDEHGIFVLCHTSNPDASKIQQLNAGGQPVYMHVVDMVNRLNTHGNMGLVIGATQPEILKTVRAKVGDMPLLIPGVGEQGGNIKAVVAAAKTADGYGMIINASRSILYAEQGAGFAKGAQMMAAKLQAEINSAL
jgi:orotidine-5'-phosphate decarboxylase